MENNVKKLNLEQLEHVTGGWDYINPNQNGDPHNIDPAVKQRRYAISQLIWEAKRTDRSITLESFLSTHGAGFTEEDIRFVRFVWDKIN